MRGFLLPVAMLCALVGTAHAEFNYTYAGLSYGTVDFDDLNVDGDGLGAELSLAVGEAFYLIGRLEASDLDSSVDLTQWGAGIGYHAALSPVMDVLAQVTYESIELDTPLGDADDTGFGVGVGIRVAVTGLIELLGGVSHVDFDDAGDNTSLNAGVLFNVTETISFGVNASFDDDVNVYRLAGRFYF